MGTVVESIAVVDGTWRSRHSALRIAVDAGKRCLHDAGRAAGDVDLLLNAGIYRDRNLGEPALAAMIQEDIGANPEDPHLGGHGTFSFDVANGAAGPLTALHVADGFLRAGAVSRCLVVSSDADPGHGLSRTFPYAGAGGAVLCTWTPDDAGFESFHWRNVPDAAPSWRSTVGLVAGHHVLTVERPKAAEDASVAAALAAALDALDTGDEPDLLVVAPGWPDYVSALATRLGMADRVISAANPDMHTAAFIDALHRAWTQRPLRPGRSALLVAVGAGITAGAVRYRMPGR